jgi:hypothetical protein
VVDANLVDDPVPDKQCNTCGVFKPLDAFARSTVWRNVRHEKSGADAV